MSAALSYILGHHLTQQPSHCSPVKMFLSSRQADYRKKKKKKKTIVIGNRGRSCKGLQPEYKSDKCEVSGKYFVVGGQMASCRHILTGLPFERPIATRKILVSGLYHLGQRNAYVSIGTSLDGTPCYRGKTMKTLKLYGN